MKEYPLIELPGLDPIVAEKGEVIVNPSGTAYAIGGKSHARGGTKMLAEPGSYILSKHLKLDKGVVETLGYGDKAMSPAQMSKISPTEKYKAVLESPDEMRYDALAKKTAALMFQKNAVRQDMIYEAQEQHKKKKRMKNDLDHAQSRLRKFQTGGMIDEQPPADLTEEQQFALNNPGTPWPVPKQNLNFTVTGNTTPYDHRALRQQGWSAINENGFYETFNRPFYNDPYFSPEMEQAMKTGKYTKEQKKLLGDRQGILSSLGQQFAGRPDEAKMVEREYAKYLRAADQIEPDKYIEKFVIGPDGKEIPLLTATDEQIDNAKSFRYHNLRTGKDDVVDYRDRQNQRFDPVLRYTMPPDKMEMDIIPSRPGPVPMRPPATPSLKTVPATQAGDEIKKGLDWQSIINGTQIGLLAADLATTRTKPPYYDYAPSEIAYTRFEPINTKQQERAFNIASEQINNSGMSAQQKAAVLSSMYGQMSDNVNQVDITNYQNKLQNDNRNISLYDQRRNTDILRQQDSNSRFIQEADRRNFEAARERQNYVAGIMDTWNKHQSNRRDVGLVNQFSRNYDYQFNTEQVEYVPGQGAPANQNRLRSFQKSNGVDPRYLNAEGLRALGFAQ
jgi:hypothetical protein